MYDSHKEIICLWPTIADFSRAINVGYECAQQMKRRKSIASDHWTRVVEAARRLGHDDVTIELLAETKPSRALPRRSSNGQNSG